jgi:hypothetical protein
VVDVKPLLRQRESHRLPGVDHLGQELDLLFDLADGVPGLDSRLIAQGLVAGDLLPWPLGLEGIRDLTLAQRDLHALVLGRLVAIGATLGSAVVRDALASCHLGGEGRHLVPDDHLQPRLLFGLELDQLSAEDLGLLAGHLEWDVAMTTALAQEEADTGPLESVENHIPVLIVLMGLVLAEATLAGPAGAAGHLGGGGDVESLGTACAIDLALVLSGQPAAIREGVTLAVRDHSQRRLVLPEGGEVNGLAGGH